MRTLAPMRTDTTPMPATDRRTRAGAWAAVLLVLPAPATPLVTLFVVVPTVLAVLAAVDVRPNYASKTHTH